MNKRPFNNIYTNSTSYSYNRTDTIHNNYSEIIVRTLLASTFKDLCYKVVNNQTPTTSYNNALIGDPKFTYSSNGVTVLVPYYSSNEGPNNSTMITKAISSTISKVYGSHLTTTVVLQQVLYPYIDSKILAQYISLNTTVGTFISIKKTIIGFLNIKYSQLPTDITGIKVIINGRLTTEKVVPRKTSKSFTLGSIADPMINGKTHQVDYAKVTHKNKLGHYTIKV